MTTLLGFFIPLLCRTQARKASSLVEAPNVDNRPKIEACQKLFENINDIKERNKKILKAIEKGYSQHMIAKVFGMAQSTISAIIKKRRENEIRLRSPDPYIFSIC